MADSNILYLAYADDDKGSVNFSLSTNQFDSISWANNLTVNTSDSIISSGLVTLPEKNTAYLIETNYTELNSQHSVFAANSSTTLTTQNYISVDQPAEVTTDSKGQILVGLLSQNVVDQFKSGKYVITVTNKTTGISERSFNYVGQKLSISRPQTNTDYEWSKVNDDGSFWTIAPLTNPSKNYTWTKTTYTFSDGSTEERYIVTANMNPEDYLTSNEISSQYIKKGEIDLTGLDVESSGINLFNFEETQDGRAYNKSTGTLENAVGSKSIFDIAVAKTGQNFHLMAKTGPSKSPVEVYLSYYYFDKTTDKLTYLNVPIEDRLINATYSNVFTDIALTVPELPNVDPNNNYAVINITITSDNFSGAQIGLMKGSTTSGWQPGPQDMALYEDIKSTKNEVDDARNSSLLGNFKDVNSRLDMIESMMMALVNSGFDIIIYHGLKVNIDNTKVKVYYSLNGGDKKLISGTSATTLIDNEAVSVNIPATYAMSGNLSYDDDTRLWSFTSVDGTKVIYIDLGLTDTTNPLIYNDDIWDLFNFNDGVSQSDTIEVSPNENVATTIYNTASNIIPITVTVALNDPTDNVTISINYPKQADIDSGTVALNDSHNKFSTKDLGLTFSAALIPGDNQILVSGATKGCTITFDMNSKLIS